MEKRELVCIGCPLGCNLTASVEDHDKIEVSGNTCPKGISYAKKELTNPERTLTSSVRVLGGSSPVVSVKTRQEIPKDKIRACMEVLKKVRIQAPIHIGDIILTNILDTGVEIVATKEVL